MNNNRTYNKHLIALAVSSALFSINTVAVEQSAEQNSQQSAEQNAKQKKLLDLERIVVTGSGGRGQTKLESSVSITTLDAEQLAREAPLGTADLLEAVPGFWVEDSGGETNNNVAPRGLRGGEGFRYIGVEEDGLPVVYDGVWVDFYQRQDITIEHMEAVRGGTSGLLTTNGPAALVNFITRKPDDVEEATIKLTTADYGMYRSEFFYGTPISDNWKMSVGGFYRRSDGVRDTEFTADHGGQLRLNLVREFDKGQLTLSAKHLNDHTTFFVPIPLQDQNNPKGIPGVDPQHGTLIGNGQRLLNYLQEDGSYQTRDLKDGQHTKFSTLSYNLDWELNDRWLLNTAGRYSKFENDMYILLNFDNSTLVNANDRLGQQDVLAMLDQFADDGAVAAQYRYVNSGEMLNDVSNLNDNGLVTTSYPLYSRYDAEQFVNKLNFTYEGDKHTFTMGWLFAYVDADSLPVDKWESQFLTEVKDNARLLDIVAVDDNQQVVGQLTDNGSTGYAPGWGQATAFGTSTSNSLFINEQYQATDNLRLDGGIRVEWLELDSTASGTEFAKPVDGAFDANGNDVDNNLANNYVDTTSTKYLSKKRDETETAWTVGFNYTFSDDVSMFGRYADAFEMPRLMSYGQNIHAGIDADFNDSVNLTFSELGARYSGDTLGASVTLFRTKFNDLVERNFTGSNGEVANQTIDTITDGVEFETVWQALDSLQLELTGVVQDPKMEGFTGVFSHWNGKQVKRTPKVQLRLTPTYYFDDGDVYLTVHHLGERYSDGENKFELPAYTTVDMGINYRFNDSVALHVKATNLSDELGLTEGNPRAINDVQAGYDYYYARPILGRTISASLTLNF
ncbi:TonB-dependent receptor [Pseudoalteromonas sp. S1727]|uniref:TonB-dependent receptor n=1 Tax=Pseudoalteromonas sp. S1727 TaxID=2066514 RepID=UPI0011094175|nr:TonB-dependent receptor [Pseudoalteromonas sp. S1727]TMN74447.1 TonB-dependent receptor [Pseudoalteromonas sp. S1727]